MSQRFSTKNGFGYFEATSALQKAIRRNDEEVAIYMAVEFYQTGHDEYLWKRLKIIASEDIGLANPNAVLQIAALYDNYTVQKKENKDNKPERLFLMHAVLILCRSEKSRLVDYAMIFGWREHDEMQFTIPDYAQDMHTLKGKQMKRGVDHFYKEGILMRNYVPQDKEEDYKQRAKELYAKNPHKLKFVSADKGTAKNTLFDKTEPKDFHL